MGTKPLGRWHCRMEDFGLRIIRRAEGTPQRGGCAVGAEDCRWDMEDGAESNQAAGERCGRLPKVAPQGAPRLPGGSGVNVEGRGSKAGCDGATEWRLTGF